MPEGYSPLELLPAQKMSKRKTLRKAFSTVSNRNADVNEPDFRYTLSGDFYTDPYECSFRSCHTHVPQKYTLSSHCRGRSELKCVRVSYPLPPYTLLSTDTERKWKTKNPLMGVLLERKAEVAIESFCFFFILCARDNGDRKPKHVAEVFVRRFREDGVLFNTNGHVPHVINR